MRNLITTLIILALAGTCQAGTTTTNGYFYLPSLGATGASERTSMLNAMEATDIVIDGLVDDIHDPVTLSGTPDYITISGQVITRGTIDVSDDTNLTAGDALTLTGDDIDFDGGTAPSGELGGTWASPTIDDGITVDAWVMGASTATTPSANDNDTSLATTAYVQTEINALGGTNLTCASGSCDVDDSFVLLAGDTMTGDLNVPAEAYDATNWNGSTEVPTKNDVRDKIETISASSPWTDAGTIVHLGSVTDDMAIGGTTSSAPIFADESLETFRANGGFITGDGTDKSMTVFTMDLVADQTIAWDNTNLEWDFSAPINASGTGPSSINQGLTVNDGGGGGADYDFLVETDTNDPFLYIDSTNETMEIAISKDYNGSDNVLYIANTSVNVTGSDNYLINLQSADTDQDLMTAGDGTNYFYIDSDGSMRWNGTGTVTLQDGSDLIVSANANAGPYLANSGDTGTGVFDFGGTTSFEITNGASPAVDATGEMAIDTTDDQLVFYGGSAKRVIPYEQVIFNKTLESPTTADDNVVIQNPKDAVTLTSCYCRVQGGTSATLHYSDGTNDGEDIVCDSDGQADDGSLTNNTFTARERMEFDTVAVSGSVTWVQFQCEGTVDAQ